MKTAILMVALMATPAGAQTMVGNWDCQSGDATTSTKTVESFDDNGLYRTDFTVESNTQGQEVTLMGTIEGKYALIGPLFTTEPGEVDLDQAIVGGQNLMQGPLKDQILASVRDVLPSAKTSQSVTLLTASELVIGDGDTATRCIRVK